jgi:glycosyltransferase involved in cell wall biosynthesis
MSTLANQPALSIVVPLGPGERAGAGLIEDLGELYAGCELVLSGVSGSPPAFAGSHIRHISGPAGRARQLNAAAAAATGAWLCFMHADSRLPSDSIKRMLAAPTEGEAMRYFDLRFANDGPTLMRINEAGAWIRSRWLGMPFGDQGLMLPRAWFERLGGFDETLTCGEDHALVWAARKAGLALRPLRAPIFTSARKYAENGWLRTTLLHLRLTAGQARAFSSTRRDA